MREFLIYAVVAVLFLFFQITGHDLAVEGNIIWNTAYVFKTAGISLAGGVCLSAGVKRLIPGCREWLTGRLLGKFKKTAEETRRNPGLGAFKGLNPRKIGLGSFLLIVLCRLPGFLAYYPGICAYDVTLQTGQIVDHSYNIHHPLAHTLLMAGSMKLGEKVFGDANTGIAIMTFLQVLALAAAFAWCMARLWERNIRKGLMICLQLFGMFYPFHLYMSVSVTKDAVFSIFFLLQTVLLCEMVLEAVTNTASGKKKRLQSKDIVFFIVSVGMQLFRNNGRYAMLVLFVILAIAAVFGKGKRLFYAGLCVNCAVSLIAGLLLLAGLVRVTDAQPGDSREMLSMPIQQFARCMLYHGDVGMYAEDDGTMDLRDRALINDFLLDEGYREYRPEISDPVKAHTNTYVARYRAKEFIQTYLRLLGSYPGDFINAELAVNAGYLYVWDVTHAHVNENGKDKGLGYVQTRWVDGELNPRGLYQDSKWTSLHELLERWADENTYLRHPILKYLFVPGVFLWLYLLLMARLVARRQYGRCIPLFLVIGYYATLFLGPVVQLRYLYPLMLALPFMAFLLLSKQGDMRDAALKGSEEQNV